MLNDCVMGYGQEMGFPILLAPFKSCCKDAMHGVYIVRLTY